MGDNTDDHDRPLWQLTRDEQRVLLITFVGGLASIVVGAAIIGISLAFARFSDSGHPGWEGPFCFLAAAVCSTVAIFWSKKARRGLTRGQLIRTAVVAALSWSILILWGVGLAAGIH